MESLDRLKSTYRARYHYTESQRQVTHIQPGQNVVNYIQDCFETYSKEFIDYSPNSTCSSFELSKDEGPLSRKVTAQANEQDNVNYVKQAFNSVPLPDENVSLSAEEPSPSCSYPMDEEVEMVALGSPALLVEEETSPEGLLHCEKEASNAALLNSLIPDKEEEYYSMNEAGQHLVEEPKCCAPSSKQKPTVRVESLETTTSYFAQRCLSFQTAPLSSTPSGDTVDPESEEECEYLIEESFGTQTWFSIPTKGKKTEHRSSTAASSEGKKAARQVNVKSKDKRALKKAPAMPTPVTKKKMKSMDCEGSLKVSKVNESMAVVNDQPRPVVSTTTKSKKQRQSKVEPAIDSLASAGATLIPKKHASHSRQARRQKRATETADENCQDLAAGGMHSDQLAVVEQSHSVARLPLAVVNAVQRLPSIKRRSKQINSKTNPLVEIRNEDGQDSTATNTFSEPCQGSTSPNTPSNGSVGVEQTDGFSKRSVVSSAQRSSRSKRGRKQKPMTTKSSEKPTGPQRNNVVGSSVRTKKRTTRVLVSEDSSESEAGEGPYGKGANNTHEQRQLTELSKTPMQQHQNLSRTSFVSPEANDCGCPSLQEASGGRYTAAKRLNRSSKQQNSKTLSLRYSSAADVNSHYSGPVLKHKCKTYSNCKVSAKSSTDNSSSDEAVEMTQDSDLLTSYTLKRKMVLPTNTPNVRRTKRMRLRPLQYWRGERVVYKARPSGGLVISGVISPEEKEPRKCQPKRTTQSLLESETIMGPDVSLKDPSQPAVVFDLASQQEVLQECVNSGHTHLLFFKNELLSAYKYLSTPDFAVGKLILKPLKEKGSQYCGSDTLIYHITQGKILLTLYDQHYRLTVGNYFYIPAGNIYNIRNLSKKECVLLFTQLKGKRLET